MAQLIVGAVLLVWGVAIMLNHFFLADDVASGSGAFEAGRSAGVVLAVVMVAAGGSMLFKAVAARRDV